MRLQGVSLRNTEKLSSRRRLGLGRRGGRVDELVTCGCQRALDVPRLGVQITVDALPRLCDGLERLNAFAEIVERGAIVPRRPATARTGAMSTTRSPPR